MYVLHVDVQKRIQVQRLEDHIEIVFLWGSRYPMLCCELNLLESADTI